MIINHASLHTGLPDGPKSYRALSQLSRFTFNPKRSHELALIHFGQYLKHSLNEGMVLCPMKFDEFQMDVYVDSDFMGLYGHERRDDPDNVRSRTGYVILLNGCPIMWKTKLQEGNIHLHYDGRVPCSVYFYV